MAYHKVMCPDYVPYLCLQHLHVSVSDCFIQEHIICVTSDEHEVGLTTWKMKI